MGTNRNLKDRLVARVKKVGLYTSTFAKQDIIDKLSYNNKIKELEERIAKLENKNGAERVK